MRAIIGLVKGGLIGGGLGFGFMQLGAVLTSGIANYLLYGLIGGLVGLIAGKPIWRQETIWTPIVKAVFGVGVCVGIYALVVHVLGNPSLESLGLGARLSGVPYLLGALCGVVYGVFVELDDGESAKQNKQSDQTS